MPQELTRDNLVSFARNHRAEYENLLRQFVETPTVSVDPAHGPDIKRGVEMVVETFKSFGARVEVHQVNEGNTKREEYGYWEARLKDGFHFEPVRKLARKRLENAREAARLLAEELGGDVP